MGRTPAPKPLVNVLYYPSMDYLDSISSIKVIMSCGRASILPWDPDIKCDEFSWGRLVPFFLIQVSILLEPGPRNFSHPLYEQFSFFEMKNVWKVYSILNSVRVPPVLTSKGITFNYITFLIHTRVPNKSEVIPSHTDLNIYQCWEYRHYQLM